MLTRALPLLVLLLLVLALQAQTGEDPVRFHSRTDLVEVHAVVVDADGHPVTGLTRDAFEVREDGRVQPLASFVPAPVAEAGVRAYPRFMVLLLDDWILSPAATTTVKRLARRLVEQMQPDDVMAVLTVNGRSSRTSSDKADALAVIEKFTPNRSALQTEPWRHTLDVLADLVRQLAPVPSRKKTLVYIGDATAFDAKDPVGQGDDRLYSVAWYDAIKGASAADISVYLLDPSGLTGRTDDGSKSFTEQTGGASFANSNHFERDADRIWNEAGSYYLLGYAVPSETGGRSRTHTISVTVTKPGLTVRARRTR